MHVDRRHRGRGGRGAGRDRRGATGGRRRPGGRRGRVAGREDLGKDVGEDTHADAPVVGCVCSGPPVSWPRAFRAVRRRPNAAAASARAVCRPQAFANGTARGATRASLLSARLTRRGRRRGPSPIRYPPETFADATARSYRPGASARAGRRRPPRARHLSRRGMRVANRGDRRSAAGFGPQRLGAARPQAEPTRSPTGEARCRTNRPPLPSDRGPDARWPSPRMPCIASVAPAGAAKVYRCGNVFQDQPCPEPKAAEARPAERPRTTQRHAAPPARKRRAAGVRGAHRAAEPDVSCDPPRSSTAARSPRRRERRRPAGSLPRVSSRAPRRVARLRRVRTCSERPRGRSGPPHR